MAFGLGELRLAPEAFWAMTPRELYAATGASSAFATEPLSRASLDDLMRRFPDQPGAGASP